MLGVVSLFMDLSSEMIHGLLPVFLVGTLGVSALTLGLIEGVAESTASIVKLFSGTLSDRFGKRKPLMLLGYGLAALTKPLFPLAGVQARCLRRASSIVSAKASAAHRAMRMSPMSPRRNSAVPLT